ncbi:hypothetical protein OJF2_67890 [Aquisphaera giovannonii]|uniref:Tetratricopeptide repeat protein n=1 Tax=Aquisphaera giovannonii TaxID=406548 RepID=A0A5B9WDZ6_9BACT|nr:tetratricopeptide repeat protein [Aquisphaera giovannonii]QEH38191.1 hypothetical protein OJF2_67890 [Aquisphaera giovannonii]
MNESDYIRAASRLWPREGEVPADALISLVERAVREHPRSPELWCLKGDLLQLRFRPFDRDFDPRLPLECYETAIALDDRCADAHNEIGYLCDVYLDDFERAEAEFRRAIELGLDHTAYMGLARVLAQTGRAAEALALLDSCPHGDNPEVVRLRGEISDGDWGDSSGGSRGAGPS